MNYLDLYSSYPDRGITAAWDSQIKEAAQTPGFTEILRLRGGDLFSRFAVCYAELRALPRGTRRALQRHIAHSGELGTIFPDWLQSTAGRTLRLKLARSLAGAALLLALSQGIGTAATITVTTKDPRVIPDGQCSLIEAIVNANADAAVFSDCPAGSGADTIVLPTKANLRVRDTHDQTYGPTSLPIITSTITIQGNGARIRRQGPSEFRLMAVGKTGDLTLQDVDLSNGVFFKGAGIFNNGTLVIQNSTISGQIGAGVTNQGTLTIENSAISGNQGSGVWNGGFGYTYAASSVSSLKPGAFCFYYSGYYGYSPPGVYCFYVYSGALTISNSTISKNSGGRAIVNQPGNVVINNSTISGNKNGGAFNSGGLFDFYGKYFPPGQFAISGSTISKNSAYHGGGIYNRGVFTIENTTISGNKADSDGGGIFNASGHTDYYGNDISGGDLSLIDSSISKNRAKDSGGGLVNYGSLTMSNTIISNNRARIGSDVFP